ncbi:RpS27 [Cordylochernes scorpioides]|uniref:40S ribosomal protein S27 n=1 Tax=Cordylochernes scorpioides TaxID=51811 RepID=A0ABY6K135_9ARAC|nr:RpS27 [Cordylochernes scorpioides]UYV61339.1 RpS27 [Cordylochernes scorpioides]
MPLAKDLLYPSKEEQLRTHKLKRLVQSPNSYFMDVKCAGCYNISTAFSHAQSVLFCSNCSQILGTPTGGKIHLRDEDERRKCKLKRLVQFPNSFFMDVKCPGCYKITTVFSHAQTVVLCVGCNTVLCQPTGGKARLTEGCSFRKKQH